MVLQVPLAGETISRDTTFVTIVGIKEGLVTVSVYCVSLMLVAESSGVRGE